jgi:hypothetical protein
VHALLFDLEARVGERILKTRARRGTEAGEKYEALLSA